MIPQGISDFFGKKFAKVKATKNVLSPLQYFLWTVVVACMVGMTQGPPAFQPIFLGTLLFCIAYFLFFYGFFALKDPSRLQTEEHNEAMTYISGSLQDNRGRIVDVTPTSNTAVSSGTVMHTASATPLQQMSAGVPSMPKPNVQPPGSGGGSP